MAQTVLQGGRTYKGFNPWVGKISWRREWQPTPVFLPPHPDPQKKGLKGIFWRRKWQPTPVILLGRFHGLRSLVGYSPWGCKDLDTTEQLHSHHSGIIWASLVAQMVKNLPAMQETWISPMGWKDPSLGQEDPLEKGMAYPLQYSGRENLMDSIVMASGSTTS